MEKYEGSISVKFDEMPHIDLQSVIPDENANLLQRLSLASKRRFFLLQKNWEVELDKVDYQPELNGKLTIPKAVEGKPLVFDGASIPLPWFVSLITIGILRPMGVMLTASIIHDFVYRHGYLLVSKNGQAQNKVIVERHVADLLLRDIIGTINRMPKVGYIGWFFVRVGWVFVKYNNRHFGGSPPIKEIILFLVIVSLVAFLVSLSPVLVVVLSVVSYLIFYLLTIFINPK